MKITSASLRRKSLFKHNNNNADARPTQHHTCCILFTPQCGVMSLERIDLNHKSIRIRIVKRITQRLLIISVIRFDFGYSIG